MRRPAGRRFSANEKEIDYILQENTQWKRNISDTASEMEFLKQFLEADVFQTNIPNLYEHLQEFFEELESLKEEQLELVRETQHHGHNIDGMLECEDISCEVFYHEEHLLLHHRVMKFLEKFASFRLSVFSYCGQKLRQRRDQDQ